MDISRLLKKTEINMILHLVDLYTAYIWHTDRKCMEYLTLWIVDTLEQGQVPAYSDVYYNNNM